MRQSGLGLAGFAGLAVLAAMADGSKQTKRPMRRYDERLGPPHPETRQQRRHMLRQAKAAMARLTPTGETQHG